MIEQHTIVSLKFVCVTKNLHKIHAITITDIHSTVSNYLLLLQTALEALGGQFINVGVISGKLVAKTANNSRKKKFKS